METTGIEVLIDGRRAEDASKKLEAILNRLVRQAGSVDGAFDRLSDATNDLGREFDQAGSNSQQMLGAFDQLSSAGRTLQAVFAALAASAAAAVFIEVITTAQRLEAQYRFLTESAQAYAQAQEYIADAAQRLGIELTAAREGYAGLLVLQKSGFVSLEEGREIFEGLSNAAVALGTTSEQLGYTMYGLGQALSTPKLNLENLNQVAEPLPGILAELDKAAQLPAGGFRQLTEEGKVTAAFFRDTLIKALEAYSGASAEASENIQQNWNRLRNEYRLLVEEIEQPASDTLVPILKAATAALKEIREENRIGLGFALARAEFELWRDTVIPGINAVKESFDFGALFQHLLDGLGFVGQAFLDLPVNLQTAAAIIIGEVDQLRISIAAGFDNMLAHIREIWAGVSYFAAVAWEQVRGFAAEAWDEILRRSSVAVQELAAAFSILPGATGIAEVLTEAANSLRASATGAEETKARVDALSVAYNKQREGLQGLRRETDEYAQSQINASEQAIALALEEREARLAARDARVKELTAFNKAGETASGAAGGVATLNTALAATGGAAKKAADELGKLYTSQVSRLQEEIALYGQSSRVAKLRYDVEQGALKGLSQTRKDHLVGLAKELDALEKQARVTEDIKRLIDETATPVEQYRQRIEELDRLETDLRQGGGPISREAEQALQRARVEAEGIVDAANPMAQVFEDAASRIHGAFTGLFENIFQDGIDSFKDLGRGILDFFKRTLAQMASLALARPVLVPVVTALGGALGVSAAAQGGVLGQLGLGGGEAGAAGTQNIGLLASIGNLFGGNSIGNSLGGLIGGAGNLAHRAGFGGVGNFLGGAAGNVGAYSNLALGGAGLLGGLGGNLIGGLFGGRGATGGSIGGGAGASLGLAFGGLPGALIGGLLGSVGGGLLGSLFGGVKQPFASLGTSQQPGRFRTETDTTASQGAFGFIQFLDEATKRIKPEELQQFTDALAQLDTALAGALLPDQIDRIRTALDGFVTSHQRGAISFEEMARQRLDVVVAALGEEFAGLGARLRGLPVEEAYALVEAFSALRNALPALDQQIASLTRSSLDAFGDQIQALEDNVTGAVQRLRDALRTGDLAQAAQLLATAQAAVLERYQTEVQLVQDLAAQVREISRAGEDFALSLTERIARLQPPGIDLEAAYSQRGVDLYNQIVATQDPARQFALLQEFTDAYDAWFQTATDRIDAATEDGIRNFERYKSAVQDAAAVRLEGLQQELEIAEQWTSVLNSAQGLIDRLRLSSSNPLPTGARLALAQGDVSAARTRLATTTGVERQGAAQELLDALERQLELGQEIYARPSREYLSLYNQTVAEIAAIQQAARAEGRSAEAIQDKIARINEGTAATVAGIDAQIAQWRARQEADQAALRAQALQGYETIRAFGTGLSAVMEGQARSQLNVLTAGLSVSNFIAQQQSRAVSLLTEIRDSIGAALAGSFAVGTDYVPRTGLAMIHQGERIMTAGENRTFGPAVDRMLAQGAVPQLQGGGFVPRETVAVLHAGETVVPAGGGGDINVTVPVTVNVTGNGGDPVRLADEVIRRVRRELPEAIVQAAPLLKKRLRTA